MKTDDLWEIRADLGNHAVRFLGFWDSGNLIVLTNGFTKKSAKTPQQEIEIATERKRDYLLRKPHG
jgi:phage-related protein